VEGLGLVFILMVFCFMGRFILIEENRRIINEIKGHEIIVMNDEEYGGI